MHTKEKLIERKLNEAFGRGIARRRKAMERLAAPLVDARRVERVAAREAERAPAVLDLWCRIGTLHRRAACSLTGAAPERPVLSVQ